MDLSPSQRLNSYRLGIDVGSNSLGWFVVWLNDKGEADWTWAGRRSNLSRTDAIRSRRHRTPSIAGSRAAPAAGAIAI